LERITEIVVLAVYGSRQGRTQQSIRIREAGFWKRQDLFREHWDSCKKIKPRLQANWNMFWVRMPSCESWQIVFNKAEYVQFWKIACHPG